MRRKSWLRVAVCLAGGIVMPLLLFFFSPACKPQADQAEVMQTAVNLDSSGAIFFLEFCQALNDGNPWNDTAIEEMTGSAPYQALLQHHGKLDREVTEEALVQLFRDLRDSTPYDGASPRLAQMYLNTAQSLNKVPLLQARVEQLDNRSIIEQAVTIAQEALPGYARIEATVYLLADGYSPAYIAGNAVVIDILQTDRPGSIVRWLAHELHHISVSSLLPERCTERALGVVLDTLAAMVMEGSATYWVDRWRVYPTESDYTQMQEFLREVLTAELTGDAIEQRLVGLIGKTRGPLYRVGNGMIAGLVKEHGDDWVRDRLGDPVGLLRAYAMTGCWTGALEILALLDKSSEICPLWIDPQSSAEQQP